MQTILVVDDVQTDRDLMGKVVSTAGYNVAYATDGDEALPRARECKPVLVLLDVVMKRMDGFKACRQLKGDPETAHIPVVLVTSKGGETDKFWGKKQGADDHVAKPFSPQVLTDVIRKWIK